MTSQLTNREQALSLAFTLDDIYPHMHYQHEGSATLWIEHAYADGIINRNEFILLSAFKDVIIDTLLGF